MADTFNPLVRTLRLHWFSVRPCFDLFSPAARSDHSNALLSEDLYYTRDHIGPVFQARRLGRRFQQQRQVGEMNYQPHGFWAIYMSRVAGPDYRGFYPGLAPMRIRFREEHKPWVRIQSAFAGNFHPELTSLRAFANCYLFPIGWTAGIVIEATGQLSLDTCTRLVQGLRQEPVFQWRDENAVGLDRLLRSFHDVVRAEFVIDRAARRYDEPANAYLVASPLVFDDQGSFLGNVEVPKETITTMLAGGPLAEEKQPLISRDIGAVSLTVLNRGTFILSGRPEHERNVPGCACSNFKNALLITMLMQKFYQNSFNHRNPIVVEMRKQVMETFRQLENFWQKPHYRLVCEKHTGIHKMSVEASTQPIPPSFFFSNNTFTGAAIGVNPQFNQATSGTPTSPQQGVTMSNFTFQGPVTNAAIGDHATFIQNLQNVSVQQFASDLTQVHNVATQRAASDEEKADAKKIGEAATEAQNGSKDKAVTLLRQVGKWGWDLMKELAGSVAGASLKAMLGI